MMNTLNFPATPVDLFNEPAFRLGAFKARPAVREIEVGQHVERLEPRVFQVLVVLARSPNSTISRNALIAQCWSGRFVSDDALNRTIGKLRRVFERDPSGSVTIETVPRLGYQMRTASADAPPQVRGNARPEAHDLAETLKEVGRVVGHALQAIEVAAARGGARLKLTIEMTAPDHDRLHSVSDGPFADLNGLAEYKDRTRQ